MRNAVDAIRQATRKTQFRRFEIELTSGTIRVVDHPEAIAILRGGWIVLVEKDGTLDFFDDTSVVEVRLQPSSTARRR